MKAGFLSGLCDRELNAVMRHHILIFLSGLCDRELAAIHGDVF